LSGEKPRRGRRLVVWVRPGAREDRLLGPYGEALRVSVRAAAERGRANAAVCRLLAAEAGVSPSAVRIVQGVASRRKVVEVSGLTTAQVDAFFKRVVDRKGGNQNA